VRQVSGLFSDCALVVYNIAIIIRRKKSSPDKQQLTESGPESSISPCSCKSLRTSRRIVLTIPTHTGQRGRGRWYMEWRADRLFKFVLWCAAPIWCFYSAARHLWRSNLDTALCWPHLMLLPPFLIALAPLLQRSYMLLMFRATLLVAALHCLHVFSLNLHLSRQRLSQLLQNQNILRSALPVSACPLPTFWHSRVLSKHLCNALAPLWLLFGLRLHTVFEPGQQCFAFLSSE
jgi:hypothetical protein